MLNKQTANTNIIRRNFYVMNMKDFDWKNRLLAYSFYVMASKIQWDPRVESKISHGDPRVESEISHGSVR